MLCDEGAASKAGDVVCCHMFLWERCLLLKQGQIFIRTPILKCSNQSNVYKVKWVVWGNVDQNDRPEITSEYPQGSTVSQAGPSHSISLLTLSLRDCQWPSWTASADDIHFGSIRSDLITSACVHSLLTETCCSHPCCTVSPMSLVLLCRQKHGDICTLLCCCCIFISVCSFIHSSYIFCVRISRELIFLKPQPERSTYWWTKLTSSIKVFLSDSLIVLCDKHCAHITGFYVFSLTSCFSFAVILISSATRPSLAQGIFSA